MKDIIVSYDDKSREIIDNMDSVKVFRKELNTRQVAVENFNINNNAFQKLLHPIKFVKNCNESKRLKKVRETFNDIYYSSILFYVTEETGNLQKDLDNAAYNVKPNHMGKYIKLLNLKK